MRADAPSLPIRRSSALSGREVEAFLDTQRLPMRLACHGADGFPLVVSLWFLFEDGCLWAATHEGAALAKRLRADARCAFEVATNEPPYRGVRGQGIVSLSPQGGALLGRLIDRYLGSRDSRLARWLLARADGELALRIEPRWISAWDYTERMRG
ncbi:MAG: pyridoxamine 5'-phosphate oxidase family protein [Myxococcota bacterium]|nr:pyridoxamine 5'-phosphate oxidase family protein [Myxococcota bacterium]